MEIKKKYIYGDVILKNNTQYRIPVYQRTYTWTNRNSQQLYEDIKSCYKQKSTHYLGSLVYSVEREKKDGKTFHTYQIVDGQQRIATIMLLLKAIYDIVPDKDKDTKEELNKALYNKNCDEEYKLKLQSIDNDDKEFEKILNNNMDYLNELSNVTQNYRYFKKLLEKDNYKEILSGIQKLIIAEIKLEKKDRAQTIFESINSTGIPLKDYEKIRNFLLMGINNKGAQKTYHDKYWVTLTELLGKDNLESYFFDFLIMKKGSYFNKEELYDRFKEYYYSINDPKKVGKELLKYADYYKLITCNDSELYNELTNIKIEVFKKIRHNTIYPFLMRVCEDYSDIQKLYKNEIQLEESEKKDLKKREKEFQNIIEFFENYAIRRNICEIPSSSLRRFYASLYNTIFEKKNYKNNYLTAIKTYLCTTVKNDTFPKDELFIEKLKSVNLYKRSIILKILFDYIENPGKEKIKFDELTVEHIFPQTPREDWERDLGNTFEETKQYTDTLGNLSITGYNGELQNKPFKEKQEILINLKKEGNLKITTINEELLNRKISKWNYKAILNRADRLSKLIIKKLKYPKDIDSSLRFDNYIEVYYDKTEKEFMIDNDSILLGIRIKKEDIEAGNYNEVYWKLLDKLYQMNPRILKQLAKNNWKLSSSNRILISENKSLLNYPQPMNTKEIDTIYIENIKAKDFILEVIVSLVKEYKNELSINDICLLYDNERY